MSREQFERTERLLGSEAMERLCRARVAVFGIGGVGGFVAEALARSGIGTLDLIDSDTVCESNLNRQIIATHSTLGRYKTEVMRERILDINPEAAVHVHNCFFLPENADKFPFAEYDYVVDAVDTVTAKIELIMRAKEANTPIISCMGAGNKLDPTRFRVADIYGTKVCPLAKVMRRELKKRGVKELKVVYSEELPGGMVSDRGEARGMRMAQPESERLGQEEARGMRMAQPGSEMPGRGEARGMRMAQPESERPSRGEASRMQMAQPESEMPGRGEARASDVPRETSVRRSTPGSIAFVPSVAGLILAGEVVKDICNGCLA